MKVFWETRKQSVTDQGWKPHLVVIIRKLYIQVVRMWVDEWWRQGRIPDKEWQIQKHRDSMKKKNYLGAESIYFGWNIGCTGKVERERTEKVRWQPGSILCIHLFTKCTYCKYWLSRTSRIPDGKFQMK